MPEIVELSETNNYYTVLLEKKTKKTAGCQQTFWSGDSRLSPDTSLIYCISVSFVSSKMFILLLLDNIQNFL